MSDRVGVELADGSDAPKDLGFLADGGEAGALMRGMDWSGSPLGAPAGWPQSLRTVVSLMLGSKFPMFVAWGPELGFLYNDPYAEILGAKHPAAMGRRFHDIWAEIWGDILPLIESAMAGEATYRENLPLLMNRRGFDEQTWFTFSYSPVRDESGRVAGMYCVCSETTGQVVAERERQAEMTRQRRLFERAPGFIAILAEPEHRFEFVNDAYRALTGRNELVGRTVREALPEVEGQGFYELLDQVYRSGERHVARDTPIRLQRTPDAAPEELFLDFIYEPIRNEAGEVTGIFVEGYDVTETHRALQALRESESNYRYAVDLSPQTIWTSGPDGLLDHVGTRWMEWTGSSGLGTSWGDVLHPDDLQPSIDAWTRSITTGVPYDIFHRACILAEGRYRWMHSRAYPRRDEAGNIVRWYGTTEDVDDAKRAEEARADGERRLRTALDIAALGTWEWDVPTGAIRLDERARAMFGFSPDEPLTADQVFARIVEADRSRDLATSLRAVERASRLVLDYDIELPDGSRRSIASIGECIGKVGERAERMSGTFLDVTERRAAERALKELNATLERRVDEAVAEREEANALYRGYFQHSAEALFVIDVDERGRFLLGELNPAHERATGFSTAEHRGRDLADLLTPDMYEQIVGHYRRAIEVGDVHHYQDAFTFNGETRYWDTVLVPVRGPDGRIARLIGSSRDKTAQVQAEDALRQAQKMEAVGQLTGGIAHDFNNLLTGIVGSLELLQRRLGERRYEALEKYAAVAMTSAQRAAALTQRLLAFSRRQPLSPKTVEANKLVASMEDLLRRTLGPQIDLEMVLAGGLWPTLCDPNQLESAILNLAINARDAMEGGGRLTIETANAHLDDAYARARAGEVEAGQYVAICVTDTGTGIAPDVATRIFEPFFTTKPLGQGTGLGLSQLYGFVKQSGGHVAVYSEPGQGSTFRLYLPRHGGRPDAGRPDGAKAEADGAEPARAADGETVLVVEDEAAVRMLVSETLDELGYRAVEAVDGPAGLKELQSDRRIDLLVTDVGLPGLNGRQLADAARQLRPGLKVLFITGFAGNAAVGNGLLEPGMEMMTKPFAMDALAAKISGMIEG